MKSLQIFKSEEFGEIRTVTIDGESVVCWERRSGCTGVFRY